MFFQRITVNHLEKRWISSSICSQDFRHCRFFTQIQKDLRKRNIEPEKFTHVNVSGTSIGQKMVEFVFRVHKVKEYSKRFAQEHWSVLEMKKVRNSF